MKTLLTLSLLLTHWTAQADMTCQKSQPFGAPTVILQYKAVADLYWVSVLGFRPDYAAYYKVSDEQNTRYGSLEALQKVVDSSTFKNMPNSLVLKNFISGSFHALSGLSQLYPESTVLFEESKDCHTTSL